MIYILTGDIRTGKTTALFDWTSGRNDVDGLLCPDNEKGMRYFLKVKSKEEFQLETTNEVETEKITAIGSFKFLKPAFEDANHFLMTLSLETKQKYLIIDELGKLELKNEGLHKAAKTLIPDFMYGDSKHLILVVRASLLDDILKHYSISEYLVLKKEDLGIFI